MGFYALFLWRLCVPDEIAALRGNTVQRRLENIAFNEEEGY